MKESQPSNIGKKLNQRFLRPGCSFVEPTTRGDPQSPLLWTCKSLRKLSQSLCGMGHKIGLTLARHDFHGEWNYTIRPIPPPTQ